MVVYWIFVSFIVLFFSFYVLANKTNLLSKIKIFDFMRSSALKLVINKLFISLFTLFCVINVIFILIRIIPLSNDYYSNSIFKDLLNYYKSILPYPKKVCAISSLKSSTLSCSSYKIKFIDFGTSTHFMKNIDVWDIIKEKVFVSLLIGIISLIIEWIISYPIGIFIARKNNKRLNKIFDIYYSIITSVPAALTFYILLLLFMIWFKLPTSFEINSILSFIPPIVSVTLTSFVIISHWISMYINAESQKDYVTFAYSKGLSESRIFHKHIARNALIPIIRTIPSSIATSICGFYILEVTFNIPGTGSTLIRAISLGDIPLIQGLIIFFSFVSITAYFIGDLISIILNPAIKLKEDKTL